MLLLYVQYVVSNRTNSIEASGSHLALWCLTATSDASVATHSPLSPPGCLSILSPLQQAPRKQLQCATLAPCSLAPVPSSLPVLGQGTHSTPARLLRSSVPQCYPLCIQPAPKTKQGSQCTMEPCCPRKRPCSLPAQSYTKVSPHPAGEGQLPCYPAFHPTTIQLG